VIGHDGTLYIGSHAVGSQGNRIGRLFAVETDAEGLDTSPWPMFLHDTRHTGRNTENLGPTAEAGPDQDAVDGEGVALDGTASTDPDFGIVTFQWRQIEGASVELSNADTAVADFVAPAADEDEAVLVFELTVTDTEGLTGTDSVSVSVEEDDSFCFIRSVQKWNIFTKRQGR